MTKTNMNHVYKYLIVINNNEIKKKVLLFPVVWCEFAVAFKTRG